jgi:hypothetical protein
LNGARNRIQIDLASDAKYLFEINSLRRYQEISPDTSGSDPNYFLCLQFEAGYFTACGIGAVGQGDDTGRHFF